MGRTTGEPESLGEDEQMTNDHGSEPIHEGRKWFDEELRKFNEHQAKQSKAVADGDEATLATLHEDEEHIYDQLHHAWLNRNKPGPFTGNTPRTADQ
jgi:hypothetical protein